MTRIRKQVVKRSVDKRLVPTFAETATRDEFDQWVVQNAVCFTVARKIGPGLYSRVEFKTLKEAVAWALTDYRFMVYAVTEYGRTAMLTRPDYDKWLKVRGEIT